MASPEQIAANRRNARKCTGPVTPHGKAVVRWNALAHGGSARSPLLPDEDQAEFNQLRASYHDEYRPAGGTEQCLVDRMVLAAWRLERLIAMEPRLVIHHARSAGDMGQLLASIREAVIGGDTPPSAPSSSDDPVAGAYLRDALFGSPITRLARYQSSLERSWYRALRELRLLRAGQPSPSQIGFVS